LADPGAATPIFRRTTCISAGLVSSSPGAGR
jgi:hypothetical protein